MRRQRKLFGKKEARRLLAGVIQWRRILGAGEVLAAPCKHDGGSGRSSV